MFEISNVGILTALAAGVISFLSPCVLPLVPGYVSYIVMRAFLWMFIRGSGSGLVGIATPASQPRPG